MKRDLPVWVSELMNENERSYLEKFKSISKKLDEETIAKVYYLAISRSIDEKMFYCDLLHNTVDLAPALKNQLFKPYTQLLVDRSVNVVIAAIGSLHNAPNPRKYEEQVLKLSRSNHYSIRRACAQSIGQLVDDKGLASESVIDAAILLGIDERRQVRDWATFVFNNGIANDSQRIRKFLHGQLNDTFLSVRQEAVSSLACRKDKKVYPIIWKYLNKRTMAPVWIDAAGHTEDKQFLSRLKALIELHASNQQGSIYISLQDAVERIQQF